MLRSPLALILAFAFAGLAYGQAEQKTPPATPKRLTVAQVWTLDATYTDRGHGVTFRYPSAWTAGTGFAYHQPLLTTSSDAHIIASYGYSADSPPPDTTPAPYLGTDLEGFGFTYATAAGANQTQCETMAASIADENKHTSVLIGQRRFSGYEVAEGGMSQSIGGELYVTFAGATCYFFETDAGWKAMGVFDGIRPLTNHESSLIWAHLMTILKSIRISPSGRNQ